jgi:hypothetical protein
LITLSPRLRENARAMDGYPKTKLLQIRVGPMTLALQSRYSIGRATAPELARWGALVFGRVVMSGPVGALARDDRIGQGLAPI